MEEQIKQHIIDQLQKEDYIVESVNMIFETIDGKFIVYAVCELIKHGYFVNELYSVEITIDAKNKVIVNNVLLCHRSDLSYRLIKDERNNAN